MFDSIANLMSISLPLDKSTQCKLTIQLTPGQKSNRIKTDRSPIL